MINLPILYRKNSNGSLQQWRIWTEDNTVVTEYGQVGGKLQTTRDLIKSGKNPGKKNETTPTQQAEKEAEAKHTKQRKLGYCDSIESAEKEEVDSIVEGGIYPMLAPNKSYPHFARKLQFPVISQPKIDGVRMIAMLKDGKCTLWSRTRKRMNSLPHIAKAIEDTFPGQTLTLDGEAWNEEVALKEGFEGLISIIRQDEPKEGHEQIGYYIYDLPFEPGNNFARDKARLALLKGCKEPLFSLKSVVCQNHDELMAQHDINVTSGYEGTMIRNDGPYECDKRSYHLQKLKGFEDHEFKIIDIEEGNGKDAGTVGAFWLENPNGPNFKCSLNAPKKVLKDYFEHPEKWQGYWLTVRHQKYTLDGVPRIPRGKGLRKVDSGGKVDL